MQYMSGSYNNKTQQSIIDYYASFGLLDESCGFRRSGNDWDTRTFMPVTLEGCGDIGGGGGGGEDDGILPENKPSPDFPDNDPNKLPPLGPTYIAPDPFTPDPAAPDTVPRPDECSPAVRDMSHYPITHNFKHGCHIFINYPEMLRHRHVADYTGNVLFARTITPDEGPYMVYFEHVNNCSSLEEPDRNANYWFHYCISFHSKDGARAEVTLKRRGASLGWVYHNKTWLQFFKTTEDLKLDVLEYDVQRVYMGRDDKEAVENQDPPECLEGVPGTCYRDDNGPCQFVKDHRKAIYIYPTNSFDGAFELVTSAPVDMSVFIYHDYRTVHAYPSCQLPLDKANLDIIDTSSESSTTGYTLQGSGIEGAGRWSFDDSDQPTQGSLPLTINGNSCCYWFTNTCELSLKSQNAMYDDIFTYVIRDEAKDGSGCSVSTMTRQKIDEAHPTNIWPYAYTSNLANWGVIYDMNLTFENNGDTTRWIRYLFYCNTATYSITDWEERIKECLEKNNCCQRLVVACVTSPYINGNTPMVLDYGRYFDAISAHSCSEAGINAYRNFHNYPYRAVFNLEMPGHSSR